MSEKALTHDRIATWNIISWAFGMLFVGIGVSNLILVHPVPGIFYLLLSLVYVPQVNVVLKRWSGFSVPLIVKVILGLAVLWATLAVTDLAEMAGF